MTNIKKIGLVNKNKAIILVAKDKESGEIIENKELEIDFSEEEKD